MPTKLASLSAPKARKTLTDTPCSAPASHSDWSAYYPAGFARRALPRSHRRLAAATPGAAPTRRAVLEPPWHAAAPITSCNRVNQGDPQGGLSLTPPPRAPCPSRNQAVIATVAFTRISPVRREKEGRVIIFCRQAPEPGTKLASHPSHLLTHKYYFSRLLLPSFPSFHLQSISFLVHKYILFYPHFQPLRSRNALRSPSRRRQALRRQGRLGRPRRLDLGQGAPGSSCTLFLWSLKLSWRSLCFISLAG